MPPLPADFIHARACKLKCEKILTRPYNPEAPAFWPAAPLRRTSVFAASENLGAGRIHSARACKIFPVTKK